MSLHAHVTSQNGVNTLCLGNIPAILMSTHEYWRVWLHFNDPRDSSERAQNPSGAKYYIPEII